MKGKFLSITLVTVLLTMMVFASVVSAAYDNSMQYDADKTELSADSGFVPYTDTGITYTGTWMDFNTGNATHENASVQEQLQTQTAGSAAGGFQLCAWGDPSCKASYTFEGTSIKVVIIKAVSGGYCSVKLDGVAQDGEEETMNGFLFNTNTTGDTFCNWVVFEKTGLATGSHTIEIQNADGGYGTAQLKLVGFVTDPQEPESSSEESSASTPTSTPSSSEAPQTNDVSAIMIVLPAAAAAVATRVVIRRRNNR